MHLDVFENCVVHIQSRELRHCAGLHKPAMSRKALLAFALLEGTCNGWQGAGLMQTPPHLHTRHAALRAAVGQPVAEYSSERRKPGAADARGDGQSPTMAVEEPASDAATVQQLQALMGRRAFTPEEQARKDALMEEVRAHPAPLPYPPTPHSLVSRDCGRSLVGSSAT